MAFTLTTTTQRSTCLGSTVTLGRCQASKYDLIHLLHISKPNLVASSGTLRVCSDSKRKMNFVVLSSVQPAGAPLPSNPSPASWKIWIVGTIMTVVFSFGKGKWGPLIKLEEEFKTKINTIARVVGIVENVAETVEQAAKGISDKLPEGSELGEIAGIIGAVAGTVEDDAELIGNALKKVEKAEEQVKTFVE